MISFESSILGVICSNYETRINLHLSRHGKVYSNIWKNHPWMTITSFVMPMKLTLKSGANIGHPIIFPSPKVSWLCRPLLHQPLSHGLVWVLPLMGVVAMVQLSRHELFPLLTLSLSFLKSFTPITKV